MIKKNVRCVCHGLTWIVISVLKLTRAVATSRLYLPFRKSISSIESRSLSGSLVATSRLYLLSRKSRSSIPAFLINLLFS